MRFIFLTIFMSLILCLPAGAFLYLSHDHFPLTDTLPPPPPPGPLEVISGPSSACTGDNCQYFIEVPVACSCQWSVDGTPQAESGSEFTITWTQPGMHIVAVVFNCSGELSEPESILVIVSESQPDVFLGNDTLIIQGQSLLLDAGNPGLEYLWSTGETTQTITVSLAGEYSVYVSSSCGSDSDTIEVFVAIGVTEMSDLKDCFTLTTSQRTIEISNPENNIEMIQVISVTGNLVYEGKPGNEITVSTGGIYLIRVILAEGICSRKVFIP